MSSNSQLAALELVATLSGQEKQCLEELTNGGSVRAIAASLAADAGEVERIIQDMMTKLSANCTADLVRIGLEARYAQQP